MSARRVNVIVLTPGGDPEVRSIPATLAAQQAIVGGLIQPLDLPDHPGLSVVVNEEGLLLDLPVNIMVDSWGWLYGTIYFARWNEEGESEDLRPEDVHYIAGLIVDGRD